MKNDHFAKEIAVFLCCLLLINRIPAYAGYQEQHKEWKETWNLESLADWIQEDLAQSRWNPSAAGLLKKILRIGWAAVDGMTATVLEAPAEEGTDRSEGGQPDGSESSQPVTHGDIPKNGSAGNQPLRSDGGQEDGSGSSQPDIAPERISDTLPVKRELTLSIRHLPRVGNGWKETGDPE